MMKKLQRKAKNVILGSDLFCTTDLLRVKEDPEYRSMSGGFCSLALALGFAIIFANTAIGTFSKTEITSKTTLKEENTPTNFNTQSSPFMFALGVRGFDLNDPNTKYFNIAFSQRTKAIGQKTIKVPYTLQPCNRTQWLSFNPDFAQPYDRLGMDQYLCLSPDITLEFEGKFSSDMFKYSKITVEACSIFAGDNRTCVNDSTLTGTFSFNYYFVNTVMNPDDVDYVGNYLEDKNYFQFTKQIGTTANVFISSYEINTDESLWPVEDIKTDVGGIVYQDAQTFVSEEPEYVQLFLRKSSLSITIERAFTKYDDTVSYIGGLFTAFISVLYVMHKYNEYSYQVESAAKIYNFSPTQKIRSDEFHPPSFIAYSFWCILDTFGKAPDSKFMHHIDETRDEISKQLDVMLMMKKIAFLENCMNFLFEEYELRCLHLNRKLTLEEAAQIRKRFSMRGKLFRYNKKMEENQSSSESEEKKNEVKPTTSLNVVTQMGHRMNGMLEESASHNERIAEDPLSKQQEEEKVNEEELEGYDSDMSSEDEDADRRVYRDVMNSLWELKQEAMSGNRRSSKIYESLDQRLRKLMKDKKMEQWIRNGMDPNCDSKILNGETEFKKFESSEQLIYQDPIVFNANDDFEDS